MSNIGTVLNKANFETGDTPTEAQFINLIDSLTQMLFDNTRAYISGEAVIIDNTGFKLYLCNTNTTAGESPITTPAKWDSVGSSDIISRNNTFTESLDFSLSDNTYYNRGTQSGALSFTLGSAPISTNVYIYTDFTADGSAINFPASWKEIKNEYTSDSSVYGLVVYWDGVNYQYQLYKIYTPDLTPPVLASVAVEDSTKDELNLAFDESVNITILGWTINTDGAALSILSVLSGSGTDTPILQLSRDITEPETITLDYDSVTGDTKDLSDNELVSFSLFAVTNNVSEPPILQFDTNRNGSFTPAIIASAGVAKWDMGDATEIISNTPSHTYADGTTKTVKLFLNTILNASNISQFTCFSGSIDMGIQGTLDFTQLTGLGAINLIYNASLTGIVFPSLTALTFCRLSNSGIAAIDFSPITTQSGEATFNPATSLSSYTQSSGGAFASFSLINTLLTSVNVSNHTFTNSISINSNSLLTSLTLPSSASTPATLNFNANTNLVSVSVVNLISTNLRTMNFFGGALNLTAVDTILSDLNTYFSSNTPTKDLDLFLNSGTNSSPTGGASNTDLLNLISIYSGASKILTYFIN